MISTVTSTTNPPPFLGVRASAVAIAPPQHRASRPRLTAATPSPLLTLQFNDLCQPQAEPPRFLPFPPRLWGQGALESLCAHPVTWGRGPNLRDLTSAGLRRSCNNNRSKVHNKGSALGSFRNPPLPVCGNTDVHETSYWCQKGALIQPRASEELAKLGVITGPWCPQGGGPPRAMVPPGRWCPQGNGAPRAVVLPGNLCLCLHPACHPHDP